jgi:hypothetical protein
MGPNETGRDGPDERFGEVLAAYLEAVDAGWAPSRRAFLERYPTWRPHLEAFFATHDEVDALAAPFRSDTACSVPPPHSGEPPTVIIDVGSALPRSFGDYELEEEISRGGMGVVFRARQKGLNRTVALKMILAGHLATPDEVRRFRNEAEAAALMSHPNIVPIYEVNERDGQPFFSMKLISGGNLAQHMGDFSAEPRAAARFLISVARAVHYAHQRGILHRDLKPANILLDEEGQPLVTDFGLAKRVHEDSSLTRSNAIVGTPCYMAPEQAAGKGAELTTAADVYALGAILYEMLTGSPPFRGENALETLLQVRQQAPVPPSARNPRVSRDLETICLKCLEKSPAKRYGSAEALADDLDRWLRHDVIVARRAGVWERAWKWAWRNPARALASGLAGVLVVLWLVGLAVLAHLQQTHRAWEEASRRASAEAAARQEAETARTEAEKARQVALEEKARAEEALYAYHLAQSRLALSDNKKEEAERQLEKCPPNLRAWEWHHLKRMCTTGAPPEDTTARVAALAVNVWDRLTSRHFSVQTAAPLAGFLAFSPDGSNVAAVVPGENRVRLWMAGPGKPPRQAPRLTAPVQNVTYSEDGRHLLTASGKEVKVWDASTGVEVGRRGGALAGVQRVAFSADGARLATVTADHAVRLLDGKTGEVTLTLRGHAGKVNQLAFSRDGQRLASGSEDKTVRVWDTRTGAVLFKLTGHTGAIRGLAFSTDGQRLVSGSDDKTVRVWDLQTDKSATLRGHRQAVHGVAFSPDGARVASASADRTVRVWDARTGVEVLSLTGHVSPVLNVAFSRDGQRLASVGQDGSLKVWDATPVEKK